MSQVNSTGQAKVIGDRILEKERKREFELSRNDRFRYRTSYFTDSGVIGSKEITGDFVELSNAGLKLDADML